MLRPTQEKGVKKERSNIVSKLMICLTSKAQMETNKIIQETTQLNNEDQALATKRKAVVVQFTNNKTKKRKSQEGFLV